MLWHFFNFAWLSYKTHPKMKRHLPILLLLTANLLAGLLSFRGYGISWDEPLFYAYADTIPAAYLPAWDWQSETVYGPSAADHKYYGPAYLLLAGPLHVQIQTIFDLNSASAWHLINFFCFNLGIFFFYRLNLRFLSPGLATVSAAFFAFQPLLWGHSFINPKDIPFMTGFIAALTLGLDFVDSLHNGKPAAGGLVLAALTLGIVSAIRILGPLAGVLVFIYFLTKKANWLALIGYAALAMLMMLIFWPFLWADPFQRLFEVLKHMSDNPTELSVLFLGQIFPANEIPRRYFAQMLLLTLSEPTFGLIALGAARLGWQVFKKQRDWRTPLILFLWFGSLAAYIFIKVPAMYDGVRHFLFILPPLFVLAGYGIDWLHDKISPTWLKISLTLALLLPGLSGIARLYPYEYTYYNLLAGETFRVYERDYWLTCYGEALEWASRNAPGQRLYIQREIQLAEAYPPGPALFDLRGTDLSEIPSNALLLFSTRANLDKKSIYRNLPIVHTIGRENALFCLIKRKE